MKNPKGKDKQKIIECPLGGKYLSDILYELQIREEETSEEWQQRKQNVLKIIDEIWTEAKRKV